MKRSTERILTTHVGSLARPHELLELLQRKIDGEPIDEQRLASITKEAVEDVVRKQAQAGIDIVDDGEQSKAGFYGYVAQRLGGVEARPGTPVPDRTAWTTEIAAFPEYYEQYLGGRNRSNVRSPALVCTGPITYIGHRELKADLDNLKQALQHVQVEEAFVPSLAPRELSYNEYYPTPEDFLRGMAEAMREEYLAIAEAGFILQIDDPWFTGFYAGEPYPIAPETHIEILNDALRGIPVDRVRYHTCYGINEGPRIHDVPLKDIIHLMLRINAGAYSFEAANARHQHEWHVFEDVKVPDDKILIPGLITHASNVVEHPELISDLLVIYANLVGRENVIAGADCGFSSQATFSPEVHPTVVWAKFHALAEGARLASQRLWGGGHGSVTTVTGGASRV
jgi:5-methyltetrahydropteroyltriglutamate--homocysteine methyltransferase